MAHLAVLIVFIGPIPIKPGLPILFREREFTCVTLAEAVNHYVALGENAAIKELESLAEDWREVDINRGFDLNERVGWVCRILFQPKGKKPLRPPSYGALSLPDHSMPRECWPFYPVAASGSTFFVLSEGYLLGGEPEDPIDYLNYCRKMGKFLKMPMMIPSRAQALKDLESLRQSDAWKAIKWSDSGPGFEYSFDEGWIWEGISAQAKKIATK